MQVDRSGQLVQCGPTPMEAAVMSCGGRVPDTVAGGGPSSSAATPATTTMMMAPHNLISARYIAAASQPRGGGGGGGGAAAAAATGHHMVETCGSVSASSVWSAHHYSAGMGGRGQMLSEGDATYTYMDEEYLRCMQSTLSWERDNGIIHLMPIAVVYQEDLC